MSGQFVVFTYNGTVARAGLTRAGPDPIALVFCVLRRMRRDRHVQSEARIVDTWGAWKTSLLFMWVLLAGLAGWALSAGNYPLMAVAVAIWGIGFASTNSMNSR